MSEGNGDQLMKEGKDKLTKVGLMDSLFGGGKSSRMEAAMELYVKAANQYKLAKAWQKAGDAFHSAAQLSMDLEYGMFKAGQFFQNAAECYGKLPKSEQTDKDIKGCLSQAVDILLKDGRFTNAGKINEKLGEMAEEAGNITDAMIAYEKAADYHEADTHGKSSANTCFLKVGTLAAQCGEYEKACGCFDKVATNYMSNNVMKFKVQPLWVDASICRVGLDDLVSMKKALQKYCDLQPDFVKSKEFQFLDRLIDAIESNDGDALSKAVTDYDSMVRIPRWQTAILLQMKDKLDNAGGEDDFS